MIRDFAEIDPTCVAAVLYRSEDDVDSLLADFARHLQRSGTPVGGIVQNNLRDQNGKTGMEVLDLMSGNRISICQPLGSGSMACKLDAGGLAEAATAVTRAIHGDVALIIINKFSKQEASGRGLRDEFAEAIIAGVPLLTAVPEKCLEAWRLFIGDQGTTLPCAREAIEGWWRGMSSHMALMRDALPGTAPGATTSRSSRPTT